MGHGCAGTPNNDPGQSRSAPPAEALSASASNLPSASTNPDTPDTAASEPCHACQPPRSLTATMHRAIRCPRGACTTLPALLVAQRLGGPLVQLCAAILCPAPL